MRISFDRVTSYSVQPMPLGMCEVKNEGQRAAREGIEALYPDPPLLSGSLAKYATTEARKPHGIRAGDRAPRIAP